MKLELEAMIKESTQNLFGISEVDFTVEYPADMNHGDYATNVSLVVSKSLSKSPIEVAEAITKYLNEHKDEQIESINIAGPGFINFKLSRDYFKNALKKVFEQKEYWGSNKLFEGKKILVEHSSPNLFKPFHIGHVMNNTIGEAITRLAKYSGAQVTAISYPSDVSPGIAKAIWALLLDEGKLESIKTTEEKLSYLGDCYVKGIKAFDEDEKVQLEVREITKKLYEHIPGKELSVYEVGKKINLDYFLDMVHRLGSSFDSFVYESEAGIAGKKIVKENTGKVFEESEGAIIYRGEQDGLHTRVFINKEGFPTYEAKDIGLMSLKFGRFNPDWSLFITDAEQSSYFEVVMAAGEKINEDWKKKSIHRTHGRMSFKGQKMSSRLGGVPIAQTVLDTIVEEVKEKTPELDAEAADMIAIAAIKFSILRAMAGKNINFDPDTSLSFEGDSGPYLQYSAVRSASVVWKALETSKLPQMNDSNPNDVVTLERLIVRFPDVVARSTVEWAPHHVVSYLLELSQSFNSWYGQVKIISDNELETQYRLAISQAVGQTIKNGLWLLGISVPEKM